MPTRTHRPFFLVATGQASLWTGRNFTPCQAQTRGLRLPTPPGEGTPPGWGGGRQNKGPRRTESHPTRWGRASQS